jgi:hypothetical protein
MPGFRKIVWGTAVVAVAGIAMFAGCASKKALSEAPPPAVPNLSAADLAESDRMIIEQAQGDPRARLILSKAELTIQTPHQDSLHRQLADRARALEGYVVESTKERTQVRIPAGELEGLLGEMETWGKVSSRTLTGEDQTDSFRDFRQELDNAEVARARLLTLLEETGDVEEKLRIEAEIQRISLEIDRLTSQLAELRHQLKFATVTLNTTKPDKDWKPGYVLEGLGWVFKGVRSLLVAR